MKSVLFLCSCGSVISDLELPKPDKHAHIYVLKIPQYSLQHPPGSTGNLHYPQIFSTLLGLGGFIIPEVCDNAASHWANSHINT